MEQHSSPRSRRRAETAELTVEAKLADDLRSWNNERLANGMIEWKRANPGAPFEQYVAVELPENISFGASGEVVWIDNRVNGPLWRGTFERVAADHELAEVDASMPSLESVQRQMRRKAHSEEWAASHHHQLSTSSSRVEPSIAQLWEHTDGASARRAERIFRWQSERRTLEVAQRKATGSGGELDVEAITSASARARAREEDRLAMVVNLSTGVDETRAALAVATTAHRHARKTSAALRQSELETLYSLVFSQGCDLRDALGLVGGVQEVSEEAAERSLSGSALHRRHRRSLSGPEARGAKVKRRPSVVEWLRRPRSRAGTGTATPPRAPSTSTSTSTSVGGGAQGRRSRRRSLSDGSPHRISEADRLRGEVAGLREDLAELESAVRETRARSREQETMRARERAMLRSIVTAAAADMESAKAQRTKLRLEVDAANEL